MRNSFGSFLRKVRRSKGLTQRELARRIGVNFTYLSKVENDTPGFSSLSEETLRKMAEALDADPDEMMARSGKIPSDVRRILVDDFSLIKEIRTQYAAPEDEDTPEEDWHDPPKGVRDPAKRKHSPPRKRHPRTKKGIKRHGKEEE